MLAANSIDVPSMSTDVVYYSCFEMCELTALIRYDNETWTRKHECQPLRHCRLLPVTSGGSILPSTIVRHGC
jgi:hypothetical protein